IPNLHRSSQSRAEVRLNLGTEIVDAHQERHRDDDNNQQSEDNASDFYSGFHGDTSYGGWGARWIGNRGQFIKLSANVPPTLLVESRASPPGRRAAQGRARRPSLHWCVCRRYKIGRKAWSDLRKWRLLIRIPRCWRKWRGSPARRKRELPSTGSARRNLSLRSGRWRRRESPHLHSARWHAASGWRSVFATSGSPVCRWMRSATCSACVPATEAVSWRSARILIPCFRRRRR